MLREEWHEILDSEVRPTARTYAEGIHEQLAVAMVEGMTAAADDHADADEAEFARAVMLPAMKREVFLELEKMCNQSAQGWNQVYRQGVQQHLPE